MSQRSPRPTDDAGKKKSDPLEPGPQEEELLEEGGTRFLLFNTMPSWLISFVAHVVFIVLLALWILPTKSEETVSMEALAPPSSLFDDDSLSLDVSILDDLQDDALENNDLDDPDEMEFSAELDETLPQSTLEFESTDFSMMSVSLDGEMESAIGVPNETSTRMGESKERAKRKQGATPASENAVALALEWIARHQRPDGGWDLDHTIGPGDFRDSPNPGNRDRSRNGATALALLPMLGAGHTHKQGKYKEVVARGLEFLKKRGERKGSGLSYHETGGTMYSHGLVAIVFCEAYAMTQDPELAPYSQQTLTFIEDAQDPIGGGWRYRIRERGDTSVVGWQLMALKSGKISGLRINPRTYTRTTKFLDAVSSSRGAFYGYQNPPRDGAEYANAVTAVGLLCRMYMGWARSNPGLVDGTNAISESGPSMGPGADMYYNYYATQVMMHMGGRDWKDWNNEMRDFLIREQAKNGNATGSWYFREGQFSNAGGRLYNTSLACMTLEVYYRFLPIYGDQAANDEFPLID